MKTRVTKYILLLFLLVAMAPRLLAQTGSAFFIENGGNLRLTNNIIVNNGNNLNVTAPAYNLIDNVNDIFMDETEDFRLNLHSPAIDAGLSSAATWSVDLGDSLRIVNGIVDLGAFESPVSTVLRQFAIHQMASGNLTLCNNIVINNPLHTAPINRDDVPAENIIADNADVFRDALYDFTLYASSPAVNAGRNNCNPLPTDLRDKQRIVSNIIDLGAFEHYSETFTVEPVHIVSRNNGVSLTLCNNIDINNSVYASNTNVTTTGSNNIFTDNDSLFVDNVENFMPQEGSEAIDHGSDGCNSVAKDLADNDRIMGNCIDIGAFEQYVEDATSTYQHYAVHQVSHGALSLCNNIIINNPVHESMTNIADVPNNNILSDSVSLFCDPNYNFKPYNGSPAVDAGLNACNGLSTDIDTVDRILGMAIEVGAFEIPVQNNDIGGGGGGGGGDGSGSDYGYNHIIVNQIPGDTLILCNNIVINNCIYASNVTPRGDSTTNLFTDNDSLFINNLENFLPRSESIAINVGENGCNSLDIDLKGDPRIAQEIIDYGAFEQYVEEEDDTLQTTYVLHQMEEGNLILCNNIIVNNPTHTALTNLDEIPAYNIVSDSLDLFRDPNYDFSLWIQSAAVNAGNNDCCSLAEDIANEQRIIDDTIDVGAFEFKMNIPETDTFYIVSRNASVELNLCNNIVINNCIFAINTNVLNAPANNILEDNDSIFTHNIYNYFPLPGSIAINTGENACNSLNVDLAEHPRIMAEIIDIGAYEQFVEDEDTTELAAVHEVDTLHHLYLYNNIIINNPGHAQNYIGTTTGSHNMLEDTPDVFVDITSDYSLMENSPAIDAGDNQYVSWELDLKEDPRISCANIVDQGAYEYSFHNVSISLTATEVTADNCQGYYILLQATPGAQHYYWSHTNEDTNELEVMPLISTNYTVVASNGGECVDTATIHVIPSISLADTLGTPSSIGKTFWFSYLKNHFRTPTLTVQISAERACSGTVSNPRTGWQVPFSVGAHSVTTVSIPTAQAYPPEADNAGNYGILVEANDSVSVYAANYNNNSFDVTDVLPVNALADEYLLQTYIPMMNAEFVVVATEDNTVVEITPSKALQNGHSARQTFSVTLQRGQTYLGLSQYGGTMGDLSGTVIKSLYNKPIAVFNGNVCALVPATNSYTDHLVEQAIGVKYWGREFALTTTRGQNFDVVRVTALRNNTEIKKNNVLLSTIQAGETYEFQLQGNEGSCYLETTNPAGVYLYIAGAVQGNSQEMSDPSMIWIPPVEQKMSDLTFATFQSPGISSHYVNIVVPLSALDDITLDNTPIGGEFTSLVGNPQFAFVKKIITPGTHRLFSEEGFIAHVYGLGHHESYGYAAGSKAVPLREQLYVNNVLNSDIPADQFYCPYEPIDFRVEVNYVCDSVLWDFGDSTSIINDIAATHSYETGGNYTVTATLFISNGESVFCTNLHTRVNIIDGLTATYYDTVCQGVLYVEYGFEILPDEAGHFTHTRIVPLENHYCDSTYILELEVMNNHRYISDTICENNLYTGYGFNIHTAEPGIIEDTLVIPTPSGLCDSMVYLTLHVTPNTENIPDIEGEMYPCLGEMFTYTLDPLSGLQGISWSIPDSLTIWEQPDDYHITLLFENYAESYIIEVSGQNRCGDTTLKMEIHPQNYSYIQIVDTICANESHYEGYGFVVDNVSDTNDLFYHQDVTMRGCDSTTVLAIVRLPIYHTFDTIIICDNEFPYSYHATLLDSAGSYDIPLLSQMGCDSVVSLTIFTLETHQIDIDSTVCDILVWNDSSYIYSGDYTQNFTNQKGCDSVVTIHLTVHYSDTSRVDSTLCRNELPFVWNEVVFEDAGTQQAVLQTERGCDSVVFMTLHILELTDGEISLTIIENLLPYEINETAYNSAGTYTQHLLNTDGCDSTLTINLTVLYNTEVTQDSTLCESELPIIWNNVTFTEAGTQVATLIASNATDSIVTMNLHTIPTTYGTIDTTVLENDLPLILNGDTLYESGEYIQHLTNADGCDSILSVNVTIFNNVTTEVEITICSSAIPYVWNGVTFTEAGTQSITLTASNNVDSTVIMTVLVIDTTFGTIDTTVIENDLPLTVNGEEYIETGSYTQHLVNANECDSILTVNVTVFYNVTTEADSVACDNELPFIWNGVTFTEAGTQNAVLTASTGVDSTVVMTLSVPPTYSVSDDSTLCESQLPFEWNGVFFTEASTQTTVLQSVSGCDSTVTMTLAVISTTYGTWDTTFLENDLPLILNGDTIWTEGNYTQNLTNADGCDSILSITVTILYNITTEVDSTVCENELPVVWDGVTFTEAGTQSTTLTASTGVDSTIVMTLTVIPTTYGTLDTIVLENNLPLTLNGDTIANEGQYTQNLLNADGCDSILTVNATVLYNVTAEADSTICESQFPLIWNGVTFTEAGTQNAVLTAANGVDSTVVMTLNVIPTTYGTLDTTVLENNLPLTLNGEAIAGEGQYTQNLLNADGCDSILSITVTILYNITTEVDSTVCESELPVVWEGVTFTEAGTQSTTLTASTGVDSTIAMTLTVIPTTYGTSDFTVIENNLPLTVNGETYTEEGTYTQHLTNANGCDSILTVNVTVLYNVTTEADSVVCDNEMPLTWNGITFTEAGTQNAVLTASTGVDSTVVMTLNVISTTYGTIDTTVLENDLPLTLNGEAIANEGQYTQHITNANGCDSILTVNVIVLYNVTDEVDSTLCESQLPLVWNDISFTGAGTQSAVLTAANGVDSTIVMTLIVIPTTYGTSDFTVIENNLPLTVNGETYTEEGTYIQHLTNANGCDSILTVNVAVLYNVTTEADSAVCDNEMPITWNGVTFTEASTQNVVLTASNGVDSTVVMNLTVPPTYNVNVDSIVCESNMPMIWNGLTFLEEGTQTVVLQSVSGCDSTVTMTVAVHFTDSTEITEIACDSYEWNGNTYDESGDYTQILTDMYGCDSIVTLHLTIHPTYHLTDSLTICESDLPYTYLNYTFEEGTPESSTVEFAYTSEYGCDSILTLSLTVTPNVYVDMDVTVLENELPYIFNGTVHNEPGDYYYHSVTAAGCDSTLILHLNVLFNVTIEADTTLCSDDLPFVWNAMTFTEDGTQSVVFPASNGADSIVVMTVHSIDNSLQIVMLTDDPCADFSADLLAQTDMTNITWSTGEITQQITVLHSGTYSVTASQGGCVSTNQIFIPVCEFELYLPNTITPTNPNGINDYFYIPQYSERQINDFEIIIYNRWGQAIFESNDKHFKWYGDYKGKVFNNCVYAYRIRYTNYNGTEFIRTGTITVL